MKPFSAIKLIGVASGIAAGDIGCGDGPVVLQKSPYFSQLLSQKIPSIEWQGMLYPLTKLEKMEVVSELCERIANQTKQCILQNDFFVVLGGDHSCAVGTWSGVHAALPAQE